MGGIQKSDKTDNTVGPDEKISRVSHSHSNTSKQRENANNVEPMIISLSLS